MVQETTFRDDLNGERQAEQRHFAIGDTQYEIDLTDQNWIEFLRVIEPFRVAARVATHPKSKRANYAPTVSVEDRTKIRAWARVNGRQVSSRGRLPQDLIRDYYATITKTPQEL